MRSAVSAAAIALVLAGLCGGQAVAESRLPASTAQPYQWASVPWHGGGFVDGFLYHPTEKGLLYARTDVGGMYRYDAQAQRWIPLMDGFGHDDWDCFGVMSMAVDRHDPNRLYATCGLYLNPNVPDGAVARSDDRGATWKLTRLPVKMGGNAMGRGTGERLQVDPADSDHLWLGTPQDGLWESHDGGKSFTRNTAFTPKSVSVVLLSGDGQTVWAGSGETGEGLFVSHDGGKSFTGVVGSPRLIPHQMALGTDGTLYATFSDGLGPWAVTNGAVWKLSPQGVWTDISPIHPSKADSFGFSGLDLQHGTLVVSTSDHYPGRDDLYVSHDGGASWKPVGPQSHHDISQDPWLKSYMGDADHPQKDKDAANRRNMGHWMDAVKLNPFHPDELVYGTGYGVWMTDDLGHLDTGGTVDFQFRDDNFEETVILGLESPPQGAHVLAAMGDVSGAGWDDVTKGPDAYLFAPTHETNQSVAFAALKPQVVVRAADNNRSHGYISYDGGQSWQGFASAPPPLAGQEWHDHRAGRIAISADASSIVWMPENASTYVSQDGGKSWIAAKGFPAPDRGLDPIADKLSPHTFYVFDRKTATIYASHDGGLNFAPWFDNLPGLTPWQNGQLRAVPGRAGDLWLALPQGLYHVQDGKAQAAAQVTQAWQVTFGKSAPGQTYPAVFLWGQVGGVEGLWRSDDEGASWVRINDDAHRFGNMRAIAGDPRDYGVVYIAPDGRGVMVGRMAKP
ncbi:exo-alpha-sialidase [Asticcacaulis sp. EMRT-3]|uniref:exo-alpha-sialidase n=1 Tax=Asticcacaulis sp. EMRT-3 TaxID=3040349 RepID=UPI0024AF31A8|nr:exo-alpha-sialidase [Asticcacaulis sp. EMRT-3]MDI7774168.1 exo-alpha-sialidase [Asticcacaulis sp. EMRT-3]